MMEPGASVDPRIFGQSAVMCGAWRSSARCCARAAFVDAGGSRSGIGVDSLRFFMGGGRAGTESAALRRSGLAIAPSWQFVPPGIARERPASKRNYGSIVTCWQRLKSW